MTSIEDFMAAIRQVESGGRYNIGPNASGASGAYQFIDSTWGNFGGYKSAYLAPPEVQDERARQLMQSYYDQFGSWDYVAAAWIGGPGTAAKGPSAWDGIHDSNMSVSSYVKRVNGALGVAGDYSTANVTAQQTKGEGNLGQLNHPPAEGLLGAISATGGQDYTKLTSAQHGDTLADRLQAIHGIIMGAGQAGG